MHVSVQYCVYSVKAMGEVSRCPCDIIFVWIEQFFCQQLASYLFPCLPDYIICGFGQIWKIIRYVHTYMTLYTHYNMCSRVAMTKDRVC